VPLPAGYLFTLRLFSFARHFSASFFRTVCGPHTAYTYCCAIFNISSITFFFFATLQVNFDVTANNISKSNKICLPSKGSWCCCCKKKMENNLKQILINADSSAGGYRQTNRTVYPGRS